MEMLIFLQIYLFLLWFAPFSFLLFSLSFFFFFVDASKRILIYIFCLSRFVSLSLIKCEFATRITTQHLTRKLHTWLPYILYRHLQLLSIVYFHFRFRFFFSPNFPGRLPNCLCSYALSYPSTFVLRSFFPFFSSESNHLNYLWHKRVTLYRSQDILVNKVL